MGREEKSLADTVYCWQHTPVCGGRTGKRSFICHPISIDLRLANIIIHEIRKVKEVMQNNSIRGC
jgi:hypothetical protein